MNQDPPSTSDGSGTEKNDGSAPDELLDNAEEPPPPPSPEAIARLKANSRPDFATSAAMVKDIMAAGPAGPADPAGPTGPAGPADPPDQPEAPHVWAAEDDREGPSGPDTAPDESDVSIAPDFYTSAQPKKRFRRSK